MKALIFLLPLGLIACNPALPQNSDRDPEDPDIIEDTEDSEEADESGFNEGTVCVYDSPADESQDPQNFRSGGQVFFRVIFDECVSACIQNEITSCDVEQDGNTLTLHSAFSYDQPPDDEVCIAICMLLDAECSSETLDAGTYQINHGDDSYELTIPSRGTEPCFPEPR